MLLDLVSQLKVGKNLYSKTLIKLLTAKYDNALDFAPIHVMCSQDGKLCLKNTSLKSAHTLIK